MRCVSKDEGVQFTDTPPWFETPAGQAPQHEGVYDRALRDREVLRALLLFETCDQA